MTKYLIPATALSRLGLLSGHYPAKPGDSLQLYQTSSLVFRVETASSTWKSVQQSVEGIPHSVSKERAPDLTERALATSEQTHFLLYFHDPPTLYNL
jgi:hypothetical protein